MKIKRFNKIIKTSLILFLLTMFNCASSNSTFKYKCSKFYKNNFKTTTIKKYKTIFNKDTIAFNEIRYGCVNTAFKTSKIMFDKFGKWDKEIYPTNLNSPILLWEKVDLFSNGIEYKVYTNGDEKKGNIYASIMIFDGNNNDLLTEKSLEKSKFINYFGNLIKENKHKGDDFYREFSTVRSKLKDLN